MIVCVFFLGVAFGMFFMSLCVIAREADERQEKNHERR